MSKNTSGKKFAGRKLIIASMHQKDTVIAPIFSQKLGFNCITDPRINTDTLGTFTGEVERHNDPLTTARQKCIVALELTGCDAAVASEGSFGPHPTIGFLNADEEILVFIDKQQDLEIIAREISLKTNFNRKDILTESELLDFARMTKFPSHALILSGNTNGQTEFVKGLTNLSELKKAFQKLSLSHNRIVVETDMRAMYNPTRMRVIKKAAASLVGKILNCCPTCHAPGFDVRSVKKGLLCGFCGMPTQSTRVHEYVCLKCNYRLEKTNPNGKQFEDPMYCNHCNP